MKKTPLGGFEIPKGVKRALHFYINLKYLKCQEIYNVKQFSIV